MSEVSASGGVGSASAARGVAALVSVLGTIEPGRPSRSVLGAGHYASVLEIRPGLAIAVSTDGVGSKLLIAEQTGRLDTVGIDCVAMNVNDVVCVGADPIALVDYLAVERVDELALRQIATGLKRGAELAGIEIPGGELAVLPELIQGHPSPHGFDLCGTCVGVVSTEEMVTGEDLRAGDVLVGLPSSGLHSNGYTLARHVLLAQAGLDLDDRPPALGGRKVADGLLEPTVVYVPAVRALLASGLAVRGLAHITGDGLLNLLRLGGGRVGFDIDDPLPVPAICQLVRDLGELGPAQAYEVLNMGCGFVAAVAEEHADSAVKVLDAHHSGARTIGRVTEHGGRIRAPGLGLLGDQGGLREA